MRIHHLNCGTMCPLGGRLMDGRSTGMLARLVCHCLVVEHESGLVLVDTGLGLADIDHPFGRLSTVLVGMLRPILSAEETAVRQIERLGFRADDVRHIVLTHLDFDHAGGITDFPHAIVHTLASEHQAAHHRRSFLDRARYRPQQWSGAENWSLYELATGEPWFGFAAVHDLIGLPPDILLIPLSGHSAGHAGVAIRTAEGWILHAGDAYFHHDELEGRCPSGLRAYQRMMEVNRRNRLHNQRRIAELVRRRPEVRVFCAHDSEELDRELAADRTPHAHLVSEPVSPLA